MMKQQSPEFLLGYLFGEMERKILKRLTDRSHVCLSGPQPDGYVVRIPLLWFGIKNATSMRVDRSAFTNAMIMADELCKKLDATLSDAFTKRIINTVVQIDAQYLMFTTFCREDRRRMTLSQIENALGYKVTIVSEEDK